MLEAILSVILVLVGAVALFSFLLYTLMTAFIKGLFEEEILPSKNFQPATPEESQRMSYQEELDEIRQADAEDDFVWKDL